MRTPDPERVRDEADDLSWPDDVRRLRAELPSLAHFSDAEIAALYREYSCDVYCAGWMNLDARPSFVEDFGRWASK